MTDTNQYGPRDTPERSWKAITAPLKAESDELLAHSHLLRADSRASIEHAKAVRARAQLVRARSNQHKPSSSDT